MEKIKIIGAGLSGLIAGSMLRNQAEIHESQNCIPNNHRSLLRFRSTAVSDAVGIPFHQVKVRKAVHRYYSNEVANGIAYGYKCTGRNIMRSMAEETVMRYIAPEDLVWQLASQVDANLHLCSDGIKVIEDHDGPIISTIPMPALIDILEPGAMRQQEFLSIPGFVAQVRLPDTHAYVTVYDTDPCSPFYRYSITGDLLIMEGAKTKKMKADPQDYMGPITIANVKERLGLPVMMNIKPSSIVWSESKYQKIAPINENVRKEIIMDFTKEYNIYSLGRFATWRPGLLLDDIVQDVRRIQSMINGDSSLIYNRRKQ